MFDAISIEVLATVSGGKMKCHRLPQGTFCRNEPPRRRPHPESEAAPAGPVEVARIPRSM